MPVFSGLHPGIFQESCPRITRKGQTFNTSECLESTAIISHSSNLSHQLLSFLQEKVAPWETVYYLQSYLSAAVCFLGDPGKLVTVTQFPIKTIKYKDQRWQVQWSEAPLVIYFIPYMPKVIWGHSTWPSAKGWGNQSQPSDSFYGMFVSTNISAHIGKNFFSESEEERVKMAKERQVLNWVLHNIES